MTLITVECGEVGKPKQKCEDFPYCKTGTFIRSIDMCCCVTFAYRPPAPFSADHTGNRRRRRDSQNTELTKNLVNLLSSTVASGSLGWAKDLINSLKSTTTTFLLP